MSKRLLKILLISLLMINISGCTDSQNQDVSTASKNISLAGSTSMEKLCEAMSESFMEEYEDINVTVEYTGSSAGIESVSTGMADIGNSSRKLKEEEKEKGLIENIVAVDGIAVIVDKNNNIGNISSADLAKIYTGEIKKWKELGGEDVPVVLIGREAGSGTRDAFEEMLDIKDQCAYVQELDSTGAVLARVESIEGAIGYVSLDVVNENVNQVKIDGVEGNEEEILSGNYLLQRPFVMATMGEISEQSETIQTWFSYIQSQEGEKIIRQVGLIVPNE